MTKIIDPSFSPSALAGLEQEADAALLSSASGYNSLYRDYARKVKLLIAEVRRLQALVKRMDAEYYYGGFAL